MLIYSTLTPWYCLLDPTEDHQEETACYRAAFDSVLPSGPATLLAWAPAQATTPGTSRRASPARLPTSPNKSLRTVEWSWDPGAHPATTAVEYIFALRDADGVRVVHDHHIEGVFPNAVWLRLLAEAGYTVTMAERSDDGSFDPVFLCVRRV